MKTLKRTHLKWKTTLHGRYPTHGYTPFSVDKWHHVEGNICACIRGFHCSDYIFDAIRFVPPQEIHLVQAGGSYDRNYASERMCYEKYAFRHMRIIKTFNITREILMGIVKEAVTTLMEKSRYSSCDYLQHIFEVALQGISPSCYQGVPGQMYSIMINVAHIFKAPDYTLTIAPTAEYTKKVFNYIQIAIDNAFTGVDERAAIGLAIRERVQAWFMENVVKESVEECLDSYIKRYPKNTQPPQPKSSPEKKKRPGKDTERPAS